MPWQKELETQKQEIGELKKQVKLLNNSVATMKNELLVVHQRLEVSRHVTSILRNQLDDQQQYSRRFSVLLDNVAVKQNENTEGVEEEVKKNLR